MTSKTLFQVKGMFFDTPAVKSAVDAATYAGLRQAGRFIRRKAKDLIRTAKGPSKPGRPPHSHVGLLRKFILYFFDKSNASVVVGPAALSGVQFDVVGRAMRGTVPQALEFGTPGGVLEDLAIVDLASGRQQWIKHDARRRGSRRLIEIAQARIRHGRSLVGLGGKGKIVPLGKSRFRTYTLAPRPFMGPALEQNRDQIPPMWRDSVRA